MNKFKIGDVVLLPKESYKGIVGTIIQINKEKYLVRFNGTQQLYFQEEELAPYKK
ncbi:hypothetical protein [Lactococcus garvieae]|uniref:hypothetical protein n=1 Tax=Lactococcus garvieae TaxID=1363 RepID=UPI00398E834D